MKLDDAYEIARSLVNDLVSVCDRITIAGSIRRGVPEVKDIEIVAVPRVTVDVVQDMFGHEIDSFEILHLENHLGDLFDLELGWNWEIDPDQPKNGPRQKRLRHKRTGICCDFFLTTDRGWGGCLAIRTGPWEFSKALVTIARRQRKHVADGYLIHQHTKPKNGCSKGPACPLIIPTPEEADFFAALGLPWIEPSERMAKWAWQKAKENVFG